MKRILPAITTMVVLLLILLVDTTARADVFYWVRQGKIQARIFDSGHQSETAGNNMARYYVGGRDPGHTYGSFLRCAGLRFGVSQWTTPDGDVQQVKLAGAPYGTSDETANTFPVPDANGITIHRYFRNPPPKVVVGGYELNEPFPLSDGDEVAPDKVPGTADLMIQSRIRNWMGLEINQKVLAWSQHNHDDYIIWDLTIKNTGNIDPDPEIELDGQTLHDLYIMRQYEFFPNDQTKEWASWYGARPGDSLRITYSYPYRNKGQEYDEFGKTIKSTGQIQGPVYGGEAILFAESAPGSGVDDPAQPQMHAIAGPDDLPFKHESGTKGPSDWALVYNVMQNGYTPVRPTPYMTGIYTDTHHDLEPDQRPAEYLDDFDWWFWHAVTMTTMGPYTLDFGDSLRIVYATLGGSISPEKAWEVGTDWLNGTATWPEGDPTTDLADYYPAWGRFNELAPTANDQAKDRWIVTGRDSLFTNAMAAQWAVQHDYNVPVAPPAPSIAVTPLPDEIEVEWSYEEGTNVPADLDGFRVYRAVGGSDYDQVGDVVTGKFTMVKETDKNTFVFHDDQAERGKAYYYYVTAFDDGTANGPDFNGKTESLESGIYVNRTTQGAHLTRAPGTSLSEAVVVPNPFNIRASELQWPGEGDKIMFMNLPPVCTIKIYTESGDLIKTLNHDDGSGDEPWGVLSQEWSTTSTGQVIVSGIYIAHIETPEGNSRNVKFLVVR